MFDFEYKRNSVAKVPHFLCTRYFVFIFHELLDFDKSKGSDSLQLVCLSLFILLCLISPNHLPETISQS